MRQWCVCPSQAAPMTPGGAQGTTVEVGILRRVGPRHLPTRRTSPTRRAPTPCTTLYDVSYIPDASGPDTLYDTVRRVVLCRTTLVRHCTTLCDTVRHCTTLYDASYSVVRHWYDTVRHSTTQYDTVRHSTTRRTVSYDAGTTLYDTVRRVVQCRTVSYDIYMYIYVPIFGKGAKGPLPPKRSAAIVYPHRGGGRSGVCRHCAPQVDAAANCRHCRHVVDAKCQYLGRGPKAPFPQKGPLPSFTRI